MNSEILCFHQNTASSITTRDVNQIMLELLCCWQKYPISLFIGSIFCHAVGFLAAVAVEAKGQVVERRQRKKPD